jgi:hypothetical protein
MTDKEIIKAEDILTFFDFFNQRAGRELWSDKPREIQDADIAIFTHKVRFLRDFINRQQAEYDRMKEENDKLNSDIQILVENSSKRTEVYQYIKTTAIKEIVDILKGIIENELCLTENETDYLCMRIDDEAKRIIGEE